MYQGGFVKIGAMRPSRMEMPMIIWVGSAADPEVSKQGETALDSGPPTGGGAKFAEAASAAILSRF